MNNKLLELIFPAKCGFCGKINTQYLCKKCETKLDFEKPITNINVLKSCYFKHYLYGYLYKENIRRKMIDFKFNDKPELAHTFAKLLLNNEKICGFLKSYDIIIPVPMYHKKQIQRGYNQSELVAQIIGKELQIECIKDVLYKKRPTKMQSSLDKQMRRINVKDAYDIKNEQKIKENKIILFDDIYTTGNTVKECSKVLKKSGAQEIAVLTIAKD